MGQPASRIPRPPSEHEAPRLRLLRCRLDYRAALREHLRGACASRVARAAGSKASSPRNLRRVGLKIVARLKSRHDIVATFDSLGFTIEDFCRGVIEQTKAMKTLRICLRGKLVRTMQVPDWRARSAALGQYMEAVGVRKLPLEAPE